MIANTENRKESGTREIFLPFDSDPNCKRCMGNGKFAHHEPHHPSWAIDIVKCHYCKPLPKLKLEKE